MAPNTTSSRLCLFLGGLGVRRPAQIARRNQRAITLSVSSPVAGWNARDPLAEMKDKDAVILDNFFCTPYDVQLRYGYSQWATAIGSQVETLASYSPVSGVQELYAAAGTSIFDASSSGAVGAAVVTGLTNARFQYINYGTAGGNFLLMVNGADKLQGYDGAAWWVDGDGAHDITGVDTADIIHINAHKSRVWMVEKDSLNAWYLGTSAIAGAATKFDFSSIFVEGGYLMAMGTWSLDAGYGMDDYAVFVTSEGQVAVYKGTDPSSATTWALVGVYTMGSPIGRRCLKTFGGDLLLICRDGLAPLSKTLMSSRVNTREMLTDKIQHVMSDYTTTYGVNYGWETTLYPQQNMLLVNVPTGNNNAYQLVMNTISGAWSRFTGWNTTCMELHGDDIYFGGDGVVCKGWDTNADNDTNIAFEALQSFNYFGSHAQQKKVNLVRPIISTDGRPGFLLGVNTDFATTAPTNVPSFTGSQAAVWDVSAWDSAYTWIGDLEIKKDWQTAFGLGYCIAAHMLGATKNLKLRWAATDFVVEAGGVL